MSEDYNKEQLKTETIQKSGYSDVGTPEKPTEFGIGKKAKKIGKVATVVVTIVGAGLVFGGIFNYVFAYKPTAVVEQFIVSVPENETEIQYDIVIKDMNVETITLKVHNQFTNRKEQLIMGENIGSFTDLAPGMEYTVSILEKNVIVKQTKIKTVYIEEANV